MIGPDTPPPMGSSASKAGKKHSQQSSASQVPDPGLEATFQSIEKLGSGGTGETWLYRERKTGELVAVKLIKRPLPLVVRHNALREITVCRIDPSPLHVDVPAA